MSGDMPVEERLAPLKSLIRSYEKRIHEASHDIMEWESTLGDLRAQLANLGDGE